MTTPDPGRMAAIAEGLEPSMPMAILTDEMLVNTGTEIIPFGKLRRSSPPKLDPCPFCGSDEGLTVSETKCTALVNWWSVECHGCLVHITANTEAEVIAAWNTRVPPLRDHLLAGGE